MHIKLLNHWSNKSFGMLLQLLKDVFPQSTNIPNSYYDAKRMLQQLDLGYEPIYACRYDCVLFWKELANSEQCPICKELRYKMDDGKG